MSDMAMKYQMQKRSPGACEHGSMNCKMCHGGKMMADGGEMMGDDDLVMRIMKKRYAQGGMVDAEPVADFESNDFDELDKDPPEEFHDTGANSGDEDGDKEVEDEEKDVVSRVMKSRSKKDKMPRPA